MSTRVRGSRHRHPPGAEERLFKTAPLAGAMALALAAGGMAGAAHAQHAFSSAWFANKGAMQNTATATGRLPNGMPASSLTSPQAQQQRANEQLSRSINNLNLAARGIAAQQAAQAAARLAAGNDPSVPDGLADGGLKVDTNSLTAGWLNANAPVQSQVDGRTNVAVQQTGDKAILNWETFNVGRNTTVDFKQDPSWAVLNKVNDPQARPSQIQGQIKADGTVLIANRNGVVFSGTSQVNTRNLVAAAAKITDDQFRTKGIYVDANGSAPTFTDAAGKVEVQAGAQITTHTPQSATQGGGYVMLLGTEVRNAGQIHTPSGQTVLAAGDSFTIRKGVSTEGNQRSTTAGNEVSASRNADSASGTVINTGLITAPAGDITLTGHTVTQAGVLVATTTVAKRGTIHLSTRASDETGTVTVAEGSTTAILLDTNGATALDSQRDAALRFVDGQPVNNATGMFDNLGTIADRRDLSRIEIVSGSTVEFQGSSLSLATGGEIVVAAPKRTLVAQGAQLDVSGAVGVKVAMESNNVLINAQGNEQRDAPINRDSKNLNNLNLWVDRRKLVFVPAGTNGYPTDRWYTQGGLLEVSGYLATNGHSIGEWMAQGGTVTVAGGDLVTRAGSSVNLSGGTLDVASGKLRLSWLKGSDGRLYEVSSAPGDLLYKGLYRGFEDEHARWGKNTTGYFYNPLIGPRERPENGYTVGRDAGRLVVATNNAVLEGTIVGETYQGPQQTRAAQADLDGYNQSQSAVARRGELVVGQYRPIFDAASGVIRRGLVPVVDNVKLGEPVPGIADALGLSDAVTAERQGMVLLDADSLTAASLGAVRIAAKKNIAVASLLQVSNGGEIVLYAPSVDVAANLTAHSGTIRMGNVLKQVRDASKPLDIGIEVPQGAQAGVWVREGVTLDATGVLSDLRSGSGAPADLAHIDGGLVSIRSTESVTLEKGALIDVSSGGVVQPDGRIKGGAGGSVQLGSGLASTGAGNRVAVLTLDGDIRGHGVQGGGTLQIESASAIAIGGKVVPVDGMLHAGDSALADLVLLRELEINVMAGGVLPIDYSYIVSIAKPGEKVGATGIKINAIFKAEADWTPPLSRSGGTRYVFFLNGAFAVRTDQGIELTATGQVLDHVPAGSTLQFFFGSTELTELFANYVVPANVFPNGVPIADRTVQLHGGDRAPFDLTVKLPPGSRLAAGSVFAEDLAVAGTTTLSTELFRSGFSRYDVRAHNGLVVPDGVTLDVKMPVLRANGPVRPASEGVAGLLQYWQPEMYQDNPTAREANRRRGASISLAGGVEGGRTGGAAPAQTGDAGSVYLGKDAAVRVDPGQSIALSSRGDLTVEGLLQARGGSISLLGPVTELGGSNIANGGIVADGRASARRILIGAHATLDASAEVHTAHDVQGQPFGLVTRGGSIVIGGELQEATSRAMASDAFVVIREGAVIDASGAQAPLSVDGTGVRTVASDGGRIQVASSSGLYLDGSLRAHAGGFGAAGGSLAIALEAPNYVSANDVVPDDALLAVRDLTLVQTRPAGASDAQGLKHGRGALAVNQVQDGGFSSLSLYSNGLVSFGGDLNLAMGRELRILSGAVTVAAGLDPIHSVSLSAPYVLLAGITDNVAAVEGHVRPSYQGGVSTLDSSAVLNVQGKLVDVRGAVTFGANAAVGSASVERAGFDRVNLVSEGDLRFVPGTRLLSGGSFDVELNTTGDLTLRAAQVYPATGVSARVLAGRASATAFKSDRRLVFERYDTNAADPQLPSSVFGSLLFSAAHIEQGGVLRAPLGSITLGTDVPGTLGSTASVRFAPGSLTSISAAGLVMPYGGTSDGVNYDHLGSHVKLSGVGSAGAILVAGRSIAAEEGAVFDLSGGGDVRGAGFVSGRGGSTDARMTPLMQVGRNGFVLPGLDSNPVYAIVPGYASAYAPADRGGAVDPRIGQQVTIGASDIPGLPAGTYTLLPSNYALLPGAFRVEINGPATGRTPTRATPMRNGSYATAATLGTANTGLADSLSSQLVVTSADVLRSYSQYNETSYADFVLQQAALAGTARAALPADAGRLEFRLPSSPDSRFSFDAKANFEAGKNGYRGTAGMGTNTANVGDGAIEVLADGARATPDFDGLSLHARDLNAIGAARLTVGGNLQSVYGTPTGGANLSNYVDVGGETGRIVLREGAILRAPEVFLVAASTSGGIAIEAGAGINTIGMGKAPYDSSAGYVYRPGAVSVVAASNGWLNMLAPEPQQDPSLPMGAGPIAIGACGTVVLCQGTTELYSEGTLLAATRSSFDMSDRVRYGTRNLVLAVGTVNAGSSEDLAAAAARGALTAGLSLNQDLLDRLLRGDTAYGAPALERLVLTAAESVNFFGNVSLDTTNAATGRSSLSNLVLSTPAIYGQGGAGDMARITTAKLTWAGLAGAAPAPVTGGRGTGSGKLAINADTIEFGYDPTSQPNGVDDFGRTILGFADVQLNATQRITANQKGSLSVYQSQVAGAGAGTDGPRYEGGNLTLTTPLITGAGGSINRIAAGGSLQVLAPASGRADASATSLDAGVQTGAELNLKGATVRVDTTVALPSGKLGITAEGDIVLGDSAWLDLAGREIALFDVRRYSWGGDVTLRSTAGNITQAAGSTIDLSARNNNAGLLSAIALAEQSGGSDDAGRVDLRGTLRAGASGHYDAGGTLVPYRAGGVDIRAQHLGSGGALSDEFAALNTRLNDGGFFGERSFQLKQGDLRIGNELKARQINVSVDNGRLDVVGTIDASGEQVGSIRLAAARGLALAGSAVLDAHGTVLRVDSHGKIIDSPNRAMVELDAGSGTLVLGEGARIDLRHGTGSSGGDGRSRGTLDLYAPRIGSTGSTTDADAATFGDIAIDARGNVNIQGARSIAVYGKQRYSDAPFGTDAAASGRPYQVIDQVYLNGKGDEATLFVDGALRNGNLLNSKLAGLNNATYRDAFHLRPAIEIASATPDGDLVVRGDLDLSGLRYASLNPNTQRTSVYGSGEVGMLTLRAGGDLSIYGSINDGFAPPPETPDDGGWILTPGVQAFGGDVVVPVPGVTLAEGTVYPAGKTLNYAITVKDVTLPAGTVLPGAITLDRELMLPFGTVLAADVRAADGSVLLPAGRMVGTGGLALPVGAQLLAGARLPMAVTLARLTWPKGAKLPVAMTQSGSLLLPVGALIASGTNVALPDGALSVNLRPADSSGRQAQNWALAQMLPEGSQSWSLRLVAGADLQAADNRLTRLDAGSILLADTHYTVFKQTEIRRGGVWYWAPGNNYGGEPGTAAPDWADDPTYSICGEEAGQCVRVSWVWQEGNMYGGTPGVPVDDWADDPGYSICAEEPGQCVAVGGPAGEVVVAVTPKAPVFSVLRTGTGDLDLAAGGNFSMQSPYGVYTAGTQKSLGSATLDASYNLARGLQANGNAVLWNAAGDKITPAYEKLVDGTDSLYKAWYPDGGGNLRLDVGGDLTGDAWGASQELAMASGSVGNWLWRQGTGNTPGVSDVPTAWWINFGTYSNNERTGGDGKLLYWPAVTGFTGLGTLGGGDASIRVGGNAGAITTRSTMGANTNATARSQGVMLAVGSTGRVLADGSLALTGGGDLDLRVGGGWNGSIDGRLSGANGSGVAQTQELYGGLVNLRGGISMSAGRIGTVELFYGAVQDPKEIRASNPYKASIARATGGLMLMQGDAGASISSRGDLVLGGTGNPGLVPTPNGFAFTPEPKDGPSGKSWFSLWTDRTALELSTAGGNLALDTRAGETAAKFAGTSWDYASNGGWYLLPGTVRAVAAMGSIYYGPSAATAIVTGSADAARWNSGLLLAPLGERRIELLAGGSLYGGGYAISSSGADASATATIEHPGFTGFNGTGMRLASNVSDLAPSSDLRLFPLFAFDVNSVSTNASVSDSPVAPSRFYAAGGDIVGLRTGTVVTFHPTEGPRAGQIDYVAAGPVAVKAGRDIVYAGMRSNDAPLEIGEVANSASRAQAHGNLIVHTHQNDVSVIEAGRDILYANFEVAGPGTLEISAGRNIVQNDLSNLTSIGPVVASDTRPGAGIVVQAGLGAQGADYTGLLKKYLDPARLATAGTPLADQGDKVVKTYGAELSAWLSQRYGFQGSAQEALAYFDTLAPEQQRIFARQVYFAELREGGREYNDADGPRFGSYLRGRNAIAAMFPQRGADGQTIGYQGNLLMYGGSGIHTNLGGDIQVLTPGGAQTYGIEGAAPPSTAGLITRGQGSIELYALGSILLGQSRVMTTFGGDILAWSAEGDINAGRGSKTTVVFTPPRQVYDSVGNMKISPEVPSTGAGIATLAPLPEVPPGDIDLIAPLGTIDAGEAGIRVSGNVNIAALRVVNAENIQVQGKSSGLPVVAAVNVSALSNASAAASSAAAAAQDAMQRERAVARQNLPSVFTVRVLGFGNEAAPPRPDGQETPTSGAELRSGLEPYDPARMVKIVGLGERIDARYWKRFTDAERQRLQQDR
ncbi:filamentous haemagglutinin family protein [Variovorax sp.]|jgi:filamentous hemagglutinin family protein|uniref:filamentous haemagglutinin family protein n=1 Tax=Variovorax sp. TaxID=1871043 RepID=UPI0012116800|nr:filamentous haemagglutinin family protein [Variovorax sp.]TAJ63082.1 MAG: filamentous hemagglutinin N-terminal domain-containing protein [Variovorax sp.]